MKCPACLRELVELRVGGLVVDVCRGGCGGIWFDAFELQRVDEANEAAGEALFELERDERVVVDPARKRECPRCAGIKLYRHFFSAKRRIEVDQCPNCAGYWLDAGELARIRLEQADRARSRQAGQMTISGKVIRYLYELERKGRLRA